MQSYELQAKTGDTWQTIHSGTTLSVNTRVSFDPITAQHIRLNVLDATDGPTIWEFQLMEK